MTLTTRAMQDDPPAEAIAIIGLSGIFPGAQDDLAAFFQLLCDGRDLIGDVPARRKTDSGLDADARVRAIAAVDRIDEFDPDFFRLSQREAEHMDPQQRWALMLACRAIWDAGYSLRELRGSNTAIITAATRTSYPRLFTTPDPFAVTGNLSAAVAGRIAYHLDLRGAVATIDTACSSSLVAVHDACMRLATGEVDLALAGGVRFFAVVDRDGGISGDIVAPDGRSKAFDARANGTGTGEGGAFVLLKRLADAVADHDAIYAVIRGSAVNHGGARSNGLTAPSPDAQAEVIRRAWSRAKIDPASLGYFEAHGTGTKLGDPIEMKGIQTAFGDAFSPAHRCAMGSIKTNIGHLDTAAGVTGLLKATLAIAHGVIPPSLHFETPSPLIDFARSPVFVSTSTRQWREPHRRAAISSFGISGTNVHLVLEQPAPVQESDDGADESTLVTLSARSHASLTRYGAAVVAALDRQRPHVRDVAHVLNRGRDHFNVRFSCVVRDTEDLIAQLRVAVAADFDRASDVSGLTAPRVVAIYSDDGALDPQTVMRLSESAAFAVTWRACLDAAWQADRGKRDGQAEIRVHRLAGHLGCWRLFDAHGIEPASVIGAGQGHVAMDVAAGRIDLDEAVRRLAGAERRPIESGRLESALRELAASGRVVVIEIGAAGSLGDAIAGLTIPGLTLLRSTTGLSIADVVSRLYLLGVPIDWRRVYADSDASRLHLPDAGFERRRCWVELKSPRVAAVATPAEPTVEIRNQPADGDRTSAVAAAASAQPTAAATLDRARVLGDVHLIEEQLAALWARSLKCDHVGVDDDYFDLGGSSLIYSQMLIEIEQLLGVRVSLDDMYENLTVGELARRVHSLASADEPSVTTPTVSTPPAPTPVPAVHMRGRLSAAQRRMWFLQQAFPASTAYHMPIAVRLRGALDVPALARGFAEVVGRHGPLRTIFTADRGEPQQVVLSDWRPRLAVVDVRGQGGEIQTHLDRETKQPFVLSDAPAVRTTLFQVDDREWVLVVVLHHIVADEWSVRILLDELSTAYASARADRRPAFAPLPIQYVEFAEREQQWLAGGGATASLAYWRAQLDGLAPLTTLPFDHARPAEPSFEGGWEWFRIDSDVLASLKALCRSRSASVYMGLLACFEVLLHRYADVDEFAIASPAANRGSSDTAALIGCFINTLVMRADVSSDPTFADLLDRVRRTALDAFANQGTPFDRVIDAVQPERDGRTAPLANVYFSFHEGSSVDVSIAGLEVERVRWETHAAWGDLTMVCREQGNGALAGFISYPKQMFEAVTVRQMVASFQTIVTHVAADPLVRVGAVPIQAEHEAPAQ